jgi:DNA-binding transcriptional regulator YiaG
MERRIGDPAAVTPERLRAIRAALGLSAAGFARLVRVESGRTVRRWEAGERDVPGPVTVLAEALMISRAVRRHFGVAIEGDPTQIPG